MDVQAEIDQILLRGEADTASQAESQFLDAHLPQIAHLTAILNDAQFIEHEAVKLLLAHGSRRWEDALT